MDSLGYWPKIYVSDYYSSYLNESYAKGWSWSTAAISGDSGTPVETVPYKNDWGGLEYNSDHGVGTNPDRHLKIVNGDLQIGTAGHGIDFSATASASGGTMSSELLDDYEEGSFTPDLNNQGSMSYSHQIGRYTKIGRMVHFIAYLRWNSRSNNGSYNIQFTGLPFTSMNVSNMNTPIYVGGNEGFSDNNSDRTHIGGSIYVNNTSGQFRTSNTTGNSEISFTGNAGSTGAGYIYFAGNYYTP